MKLHRLVVCGAATCLSLAGSLEAQVSRQPTLRETASWLAAELPRLATFHERLTRSSANGPWSSEYSTQMSSAAITNCHLTFTLEHDTYPTPSHYRATHFDIDLRHIDLGALPVQVYVDGNPSVTVDPPTWEIDFAEAAGSARVILLTSNGESVPQSQHIYALRFGDESSAMRAERAIARAAALCGAPKSAF